MANVTQACRLRDAFSKAPEMFSVATGVDRAASSFIYSKAIINTLHWPFEARSRLPGRKCQHFFPRFSKLAS